MSEKCGMMMLKKSRWVQSSGAKKSRLWSNAAGTTRHVARVINRRDRAIECAPLLLTLDAGSHSGLQPTLLLK